MRHKFVLLVYYALAYNLPDVYFPGGRACNRLRCLLLARILPAFGARNEVDSKVYLGDGSDVRIGSRCQINRNCRLNRVNIGNYVMIGPETVVVQELHITESVYQPMVEQGRTISQQTVIEDDVWIGTRVIIMPGVRIGAGSVVGAGAVVTHDVPPYSVAAGVPARVLRDRRANAGNDHAGKDR